MLAKLVSYAFVLVVLMAFVGLNFAEAKKSCSPANVVVNGEHYCPPDAPFDEEEHGCCRPEESAESGEEGEKPHPKSVNSKASKNKKNKRV